MGHADHSTTQHPDPVLSGAGCGQLGGGEGGRATGWKNEWHVHVKLHSVVGERKKRKERERERAKEREVGGSSSRQKKKCCSQSLELRGGRRGEGKGSEQHAGS